MIPEFKESISEAKTYCAQIEDPSHDIIHVQSVVDHALKIAKNYPDVDASLIEVAAWWHDVGRLYGKVHEQRSAEMANESLRKLQVDEKTCKAVFDAIVFHKWSMQPQTIEGEIIRDADKLDFISIARWKSCLDHGDFESLNDLAGLVPRLRDEFLHLDVSRRIFDEEIVAFKAFVGSVHDLAFRDLKERILADGTGKRSSYPRILNKAQLIERIKHIHFDCFMLCKRAFGKYLPHAGNVGVFCHDDAEYRILSKVREELTVPTGNPDQKYFLLHEPIVVLAKGDVPETIYTYLYIRYPDSSEYGQHTGDVDFFIGERAYAHLKDALLNGTVMKGAMVYDHPTQDMIELSSPDVDALGYVSTKKMTEKVRVKF